MEHSNSMDDEEVMTDADFEKAMELLKEEGNEEVNELLMAMSENRIISWDEAERILGDTSNEPVKSSLPQQTRPTEPDNDTDVEYCCQRLANNDPKLVEVNLNNMKRTPVPKIKRLIEAIRDNEHLEKLSLANMGLYDQDLQPLIEVVEQNCTLRCLNLETNYLSGDFFARLLKAALVNQALEELKAVNQGVAFSTQAEREIIEATMQNRGLTKLSINLRLPEGRFKVEQATIRNQEIRRILRRQMLQAEKEEQQKKPPTAKKEVGKKAEEEKEEQQKKPPTAKKEVGKKAEEKKEPVAKLKRERSESAAEIAQKKTTPTLAIAGVNSATHKPSTSEAHPKPPLASDKKLSAVRDRARETDEKAKKPYEPAKTAERMILAEKAKEGRTAKKWPPGGEEKEKATESSEEKKEEEPKKGGMVPSWRQRMTQQQEKPPTMAEQKGSQAIRDKFERKASVDTSEKAKEEPPKGGAAVKLGARTAEKLAAARGKFEQQAKTPTEETKPAAAGRKSSAEKANKTTEKDIDKPTTEQKGGAGKISKTEKNIEKPAVEKKGIPEKTTKTGIGTEPKKTAAEQNEDGGESAKKKRVVKKKPSVDGTSSTAAKSSQQEAGAKAEEKPKAATTTTPSWRDRLGQQK